MLAVDHACRVHKVRQDGSVSTIAGTLGPCLRRRVTAAIPVTAGRRLKQSMRSAYGIAADQHGNLFIADTKNHCIRRVDSNGIIETFAGVCGRCRGGYSGDLGPATEARLRQPHGVAVDADGNVYIADTENFRIRKVSPDGIISTVAGNGADFITAANAAPQ